jgi:hypothetical protein
MFRRVNGSVSLGVMLLLSCVGCGGGGDDFEAKLAPVSGTIKVDGKPEAGLLISFEPLQDTSSAKASSIVGKGSIGTTNAEGKYELSYGDGGAGAVIGNHLVRVTTVGAGLGADESAPVSNVKIPAKYNTQSGLVQEVKEGPNTFDMEIKTK